MDTIGASNFLTGLQKNGDAYSLEQLCAKVDEIIAAANTNTTNIALVNAKFVNLSDPVTITISTITANALNTAFESVETQQKTTIATLKA
jgi:hypothetical protein